MGPTKKLFDKLSPKKKSEKKGSSQAAESSQSSRLTRQTTIPRGNLGRPTRSPTPSELGDSQYIQESSSSKDVPSALIREMTSDGPRWNDPRVKKTTGSTESKLSRLTKTAKEALGHRASSSDLSRDSIPSDDFKYDKGSPEYLDKAGRLYQGAPKHAHKEMHPDPSTLENLTPEAEIVESTRQYSDTAPQSSETGPKGKAPVPKPEDEETPGGKKNHRPAVSISRCFKSWMLAPGNKGMAHLDELRYYSSFF